MHDDDSDTLRRILRDHRRIAVVGLSAEWHRPSFFAAKYLQGKGFRILPVNPRYAGGTGEPGPLTPDGRALLKEMSHSGLILDLAHLSDRGVADVVARTRAPVIISHAGLRAFRHTARNPDDATVRAVARTGGVIGIMYSRTFLGSRELSRVVEELVHLVNVGGEDVAALGSDFDGWVVPPRGLRDVTGLPGLVARVWDALGERVTRKVLGENALRVLDAVPLRVGRWRDP